MDIQVCRQADCKIILEDKDPSDCARITIILRHTVETIKAETASVEEWSFTNSKVEVEPSKDGWITIYQILIPTKDLMCGLAISNYPSGVYYESEGEIRKIVNYLESESSVEELMNIVDVEGTTITRYKLHFFSTCLLEKCYFNYCTLLIDSGDWCKKCFTDSSTNELVFKRDIVWMMINIIRYLVERGTIQDFIEAQKLLEQVNGCNGLCADSATNSGSTRRCGCKH